MSKETHDQRLARWARDGKAGSEPIAAATVVLLRDGRDGIETLMLRRNSKIAFGGMWVFPGGRVDEADRAGLAPDDELGAARIAAVREAQEEASLEIVADSLVPLAHWTPPAVTPRRFLTWFFLAEAPGGDVQVDLGEIREHAWMSVAEAFAKRDAQEIELAPPTFVTLHTLATHASVREALEHASRGEPEFFETRISVAEDGPIALWHGDAGYDTSDAQVPGTRHRLAMTRGAWTYERA